MQSIPRDEGNLLLLTFALRYQRMVNILTFGSLGGFLAALQLATLLLNYIVY